MTQAYFLTGTDTDVGKTFVACALLHAWREQGLRTLAYKPVAAGATLIDGQLINEDAQQLRAAASEPASLAEINPLCFAPAIAPHLAAHEAGQHININQLVSGAIALQARANRLIIEGAGGFLVPLDDTQNMADLAVTLGQPVILVVGLRLGCLNHAQLTQEAIRLRGLPLAGWVGNVIDPNMSRLDDNIASLRRLLKAPCLGIVPRCPSAQAAATYLQPHLLASTAPPGITGGEC